MPELAQIETAADLSKITGTVAEQKILCRHAKKT